MTNLIEKKGIIVAVISGLIATSLVFVWLKQREQDALKEASERLKEREARTADVVLAKEDISEGKVIEEEMLYTKRANKNSLPAGAVTSLARVVGSATSESIKKDSLIVEGMFILPSSRETTLAMKTPIGKRAITIPVDNISSLAGLIKPGDYVDVISLVLLPAQDGAKQTAQPATVPLFQNVLVLSVGSRIRDAQRVKDMGTRRRGEAEGMTAKESEEMPTSVTLALTPEEVNILMFVQEQSKINLVLRSPGDANTIPAEPANFEAVLRHLFPNVDFNKKSEKPEEPKEEPKPQIEIIRGFKKEMMPLSQNK